MKARFIGSGIGNGFETMVTPGDVAVGAENWHLNVLVCCPVCHELHVVDTHDPKRWTWDLETLTITPSYKITDPHADHSGGVCHWNLTNGEFIVHGDSTAKPPPTR